ncbi:MULTISPECIES: metal ABC transporter permease [unclassified Nostoc]|uniref:metal ABC transporter permease n=1 Tax=unclassified Nostoc TaxID=2593658 RepID=UPI0025F83F86|nr:MULTISPECIES: metal ABC transporter permease [unclassified Nostoc]
MARTVAFFLGAFICGTLSTFVIAWIQSQSRIKVDVAMALVFSALGIMLVTLLKSKLDLHEFLSNRIQNSGVRIHSDTAYLYLQLKSR